MASGRTMIIGGGVRVITASYAVALADAVVMVEERPRGGDPDTVKFSRSVGGVFALIALWRGAGSR